MFLFIVNQVNIEYLVNINELFSAYLSSRVIYKKRDVYKLFSK